MATYRFVITASGLDGSDDEIANKLYEAGCGDATVSFREGRVWLNFDREGTAFETALVSAVRDIRRTGADIKWIAPDEKV